MKILRHHSSRRELIMATIEVTVCDVCRNPNRGTTRFQIWEGESNGVIDLCDEHAKPLRELLKLDQRLNISRKKVAIARKAPVRRRRTGFDSAITTMDEIEARKQP
jgi:hypothetical protein